MYPCRFVENSTARGHFAEPTLRVASTRGLVTSNAELLGTALTGAMPTTAATDPASCVVQHRGKIVTACSSAPRGPASAVTTATPATSGISTATRSTQITQAHPSLLLQIQSELCNGLLLLSGTCLQPRRDLLESAQVHTHWRAPAGWESKAMARQLVGSPHHLGCLHWVMQLQTASCQHGIELVVHPAALICKHGIMQRQRFLQAAVQNACLHKASVDLHVRAKPVFGAHVLNHLEGLVQTPRMPQQLHQDAQRVIRRDHSVRLHLIQDAKGILNSVLLGAAVQNGIVHDLIRGKLVVLLHLLKDVKGTVDISFGAITLHEGRICNDVWLNAGLCHVLQEL